MIALLIQEPQAAKNYIEDPAASSPIDGWGQLEKLASTFSHVDGLFYFTYAVCIFFFVLITGVLFYSVVKYRRKTFDQPAAANITHNTPLEVVWTVVPLIIVMVMFAWGWKGSLDMTVVPANARQYKATARQWSWEFAYPNDPEHSVNELWLEVDKPAAFTLESKDVLHAFYMPSMRVKRDVVPGRYQTIWFHPKEIGEFHLFCAEYCGKDHSKMYTKVHVVSAGTYAGTVKGSPPWYPPYDAKHPEKLGESIYRTTCANCHFLDGRPSVGPSWLGLFVKEGDKVVGGKREVLVDGKQQTITVDDAYITESIRKPDAKKAVGFEKNAMSVPDQTDLKIQCIIAFMKTLAK